MKGEVYGFTHIVDGNRGVIGIRNPTVLAQKAEFVCDEKAGFWPSDEPFFIMETYPRTCAMAKAVRYGESIELDLSGHELRVLEVGQQHSLPRPMALGEAGADPKCACRLFPQCAVRSSRQQIHQLIDRLQRNRHVQ